jgi:hypothetical protein
VLRFSDGVSVDTSGELRLLHLSDGWYVVGKGMMIPVDSAEDGRKEIERMNSK